MWICPRCGRQFKEETREHSCEVFTIDDHLRGKPDEMRQLYLAFEAALKNCGPVSVAALKTMICFRRESNFIAIAIRKERILLTMLLPPGLSSPRFRTAKPYGRKSHVELELRSTEDLDEEMLGWIQQAYDLAAPSADRDPPVSASTV